MIGEKFTAFVVGLGLDVVVFNSSEKFHLRVKRCQRGLEGTNFFGMFVDGKCAQSRGNFAFARAEAPDEVSSKRTTGERVDGNASKAATFGCVGGNADDRNFGADGAAHGSTHGFRAAGINDDAVRFRVESITKGVLFAVTEERVSAKIEFDVVHAERAGGVGDTATDFVPVRIRSGADEGVDGDAKVFALREKTGGEIGTIAERTGNLKNARASGGADAGMIVKSAVNGTGGDTESAGDVEERGFVTHGVRQGRKRLRRDD